MTTELIRVLHTLFILPGLAGWLLALPRAAAQASPGQVSSKGPLGQHSAQQIPLKQSKRLPGAV